MSVRVSIILPTFNRVVLLREALESCLRQSLPDLEVIVVVDGSTDGTNEYLSTVKDNRVRVMRQDNAGLCHALNRGMAAARGTYIQILNDDDRLPVDSSETMARFLDEHADVGAVFGENQLISGSGRPAGCIRAPDPERHIRMMGRQWMWSKPMFRASLVGTVGGFKPEYDRVEDVDFYLRLRAHCRLALIRHVTYEYRRHAGASMSSRIHTFIMPGLHMLLGHLDEGTIRPDETTARRLCLERVRLAHFVGHPEVAAQVLALARARGETFAPGLERVAQFYGTRLGHLAAWVALHAPGVVFRLRALVDSAAGLVKRPRVAGGT